MEAMDALQAWSSGFHLGIFVGIGVALLGWFVWRMLRGDA
jgi:hypothetical protein